MHCLYACPLTQPDARVALCHAPRAALRRARALSQEKEKTITTAEGLLRPAPGTEGVSSDHTRDVARSTSSSLMTLVLLATIGVLTPGGAR